MKRNLFGAVLFDIRGDGIDIDQDLTSFLRVFDLNAIFTAQQNDQFDGVDGIQSEPFAEQGLIVFYIIGIYRCEVQKLNDLLF